MSDKKQDFKELNFRIWTPNLKTEIIKCTNTTRHTGKKELPVLWKNMKETENPF